jgi:hypothetical protein
MFPLLQGSEAAQRLLRLVSTRLIGFELVCLVGNVFSVRQRRVYVSFCDVYCATFTYDRFDRAVSLLFLLPSPHQLQAVMYVSRWYPVIHNDVFAVFKATVSTMQRFRRPL